MIVTPRPDDPMDRRAFRIWFAVIVAGSAVLRLVYVVAAKRGEAVVGDQIYYSAQAVTIANGRWFADPFVEGAYAADHAPLTSLLLAPVSWSDDNPFLAQRLLMACFGVAVVIGIGVLARWLFGRRVALVAAFLAAIYANLWINDGLLMSETFAAAGVVAVLVTVYVYDLRRTMRWAVAVGLALGLAGLARAELLLLGPLVVVPLALTDRDGAPWSVRVRQLVAAGAVSLLVIAPWVIRNLVRFEDTTIVSTQDGLTLLGANCPDTYAGPGKGFWSLQCTERVEVPAGADQSERSTIYRETAIDYIGDHLGEVPGVVLARLGRGLSVWQTDGMRFLNTGEGRETWASDVALWQYWILAPLAVVGWWRWPSAQPRWPALVTAGLSLVTIMAFYGIVRFRIPAEVVIVLGAAVTVQWAGQAVADRFRSRRSGTPRRAGLPAS
jgi:hypothetical protein